MNTTGVPIYSVILIDSTHLEERGGKELRHAANWAVTGKDLTKFEDINLIETKSDITNVQIGEWPLLNNCDLIRLDYDYIVEDKTNGNYLDYIWLVKFKLEDGVASLIEVNDDPN